MSRRCRLLFRQRGREADGRRICQSGAVREGEHLRHDLAIQPREDRDGPTHCLHDDADSSGLGTGLPRSTIRREVPTRHPADGPMDSRRRSRLPRRHRGGARKHAQGVHTNAQRREQGQTVGPGVLEACRRTSGVTHSEGGANKAKKLGEVQLGVPWRVPTMKAVSRSSEVPWRSGLNHVAAGSPARIRASSVSPWAAG